VYVPFWGQPVQQFDCWPLDSLRKKKLGLESGKKAEESVQGHRETLEQLPSEKKVGRRALQQKLPDPLLFVSIGLFTSRCGTGG
jgi:hypothetical protein